MQEVKIELFEAQVFVFWDCKPIEVKKYIEKKLRGLPQHILDWLEDNNEEPPKGVCLSNYKKSASMVIWLENAPKDDVGLFVHEVGHAVHRIMSHWSIELDENSQEIMAMLMGYITNKVLPSKNK